MNTLCSEIIVGIDFGTTYSGVSWALNEGSKKIRLITDWPNPAASISNDDKVPSVISYEKSQVQNWGYEVTVKDEAFRWIKILLEPESKYAETTRQVRECNELLSKINKTADEVVRDYFKQIWSYTKEDIRKRVGDNEWENIFTVHVVLTVPAMWSHAAKDKTLKAAKAAGLPSTIKLVTEPEAAALATLRDKAKEATLQKGDVFVVCDAGGGTVDLISYKVNSVQPLQVEECAIGDGGLCGSVFLDIAFERTIKTLVGQDQYSKIKDKDKKHMLRMFEFGVKRCFTQDSTKDYTVELRGVQDSPKLGIVDDSISLSHSMLKTVFDHVCGQIDVLVDKQVRQVEKNGLVVKAILLVGGFGSSKYLHKYLENIFSSRNIVVLQVDGAWSAICRGACMWGLEHVDSLQTVSPQPTVVSRISKYSYGAVLSEPFDERVHLEEDRYTDPADGKDMAQQQMSWLLKKGDIVKEGHVLSIQAVWERQGCSDQTFVQPLMFCDQDKPPTRKNDNVKQLCTVDFNVPESTIRLEPSFQGIVPGEEWRRMTTDISIKVGNADLHYAVHYRQERVGHVKVDYMENF